MTKPLFQIFSILIKILQIFTLIFGSLATNKSPKFTIHNYPAGFLYICKEIVKWYLHFSKMCDNNISLIRKYIYPLTSEDFFLRKISPAGKEFLSGLKNIIALVLQVI